jgi:hypothetical protein
MKGLSVVGLVLLLLGVIGFAYQGITYSKREKVLDIGSVQATKSTHETIHIPAVWSGLALTAGVLLLVAGNRLKNNVI